MSNEENPIDVNALAALGPERLATLLAEVAMTNRQPSGLYPISFVEFAAIKPFMVDQQRQNGSIGHLEMVSNFLLILHRVITIQHVIGRLKRAEKLGRECALNFLSVGIRMRGWAYRVVRRVGQGVAQQAGERKTTTGFPPGAPQHDAMTLIGL